MNLITNRSSEIAQWIDSNCSEDSSYTVSRSWNADQLKAISAPPVEIELCLTDVDQLLFDIAWAGAFIKSPINQRHYDDTEINRTIFEIQVANQRLMEACQRSGW